MTCNETWMKQNEYNIRLDYSIAMRHEWTPNKYITSRSHLIFFLGKLYTQERQAWPEATTTRMKKYKMKQQIQKGTAMKSEAEPVNVMYKICESEPVRELLFSSSETATPQSVGPQKGSCSLTSGMLYLTQHIHTYTKKSGPHEHNNQNTHRIEKLHEVVVTHIWFMSLTFFL